MRKPLPIRDVILVLPCYNEATRLDVRALQAFGDAHPGLRMILVDDGSTDSTAAVLRGLERERPGTFSVLSLDRNHGKAEAVRQGVLAALAAQPAPRYVGFWDADLATPLEALHDFYYVLEDRPWIDIAAGARVALLGRCIERRRARHYLGRVFATIVSLILDLRVYDTQCGAKLFRVGERTASLFAEPFRTRWIFDVEIIGRFAARATNREAVERGIYEMPLTEWRDISGSRLRWWDFLLVALDLAIVWRDIAHRRARARQPGPARPIGPAHEPQPAPIAIPGDMAVDVPATAAAATNGDDIG